MTSSWYHIRDTGLIVDLHIQPKASCDRICGIYNDRLKVQIMAPPVDGKANQYLNKWLAKQLKIRKRDIELISGETGRSKRVLIQHDRPEDLVASLKRWL
ncbi:MAG: YggU family protein [Gammaproteobacteria bacterium]|nr:MAG: YggU family protein [Gammaproteobacteria bacterium]